MPQRSSPLAAAKSTKVGNPWLNIGIFGLFVGITLVVVLRAAATTRPRPTTTPAGGPSPAPQNGTAIAGDYLSAASFLGIVGAIAINGYDGFLYSIGFLVAWLVALLLVAELLRNTGKFTMADVLSFRLKQRPVRIAAAISTLAVCFFYLLAQMAGAGGTGLPAAGHRRQAGPVPGHRRRRRADDRLRADRRHEGHHLGADHQGLPADRRRRHHDHHGSWPCYGFNLSALLGARSRDRPATPDILNPGLQYGKSETSKLDFISLALALVLGTAGLPHVLMRFYTVPTAKEARRSVVWAIWLIGGFYLFTLVLGYGAGALIGAEKIKAAPGGVNSAAPLLAFELGGPLLLGLISAVAFATILAVVAGLTITAAASFAHDIYAIVIAKGKSTPAKEMKVARRTVVVIGIFAIVGGIGAQGQNVAFLVALAFAVAASANLPTILYSLFWKKFTTQGAVWTMYGGLVSAILLIVFSPVISGPADLHDPGCGLRDLPAGQPGHRLDPAGLLPGLAGLGAGQEHRGPDQVRRKWKSARSPASAPKRPSTTNGGRQPNEAKAVRSPPARRRPHRLCIARRTVCPTPARVAKPDSLANVPLDAGE